ncbi:hypothetical protein Bca4012_055741 [Brassica carinata]
MAARRIQGKDSKAVTAIAIDKDKNSQHALKWAVDNIERTQKPHMTTKKRRMSSSFPSEDSALGKGKFKSVDVPMTLLKTTPETCAVFIVSKEKLLTSRSASRPQTPQHTPQPSKQQPALSMLFDLDSTSSSYSESGRSCPALNGDVSPPTSHYKSCVNMSSTSEFSNGLSHSGHSCESNASFYSVLGRSTYGGSSHSSTSMCEITDGEEYAQNQNLEAEVRRLRLELQQFNTSIGRVTDTHLQGPGAAAESEREMLRALSEMDKQKKTQSTIQATNKMTQQDAEMEKQRRRLAEMQARFKEQKMADGVSYRRYSIREVEDATDGFSDALKVGEGGYGPVYKAVLENTSVAIKILKSDVSQGLKQFQQEVEVLSCMRHPNMVILLGACPEYGCLVYEYMENGTLEDRLFCKDNTPPLSWRARFRIAAEIATGLLFLHQAKPEPLVHRDLKPANILLDRYMISKISDVGLARLVPAAAADSFTQYHMTAAAGTFCYIDPEYQQTGMLGVKSDLYSFGVVLLQILTAMPAMGLSHRVEKAIEKRRLREVLDPKISDWPAEETLVLAQLALQCCELRKKDRPDLATVLLPALNKLREIATEEHEVHNSSRTFPVSVSHNSIPLSPISS